MKTLIVAGVVGVMSAATRLRRLDETAAHRGARAQRAGLDLAACAVRVRDLRTGTSYDEVRRRG